MLFDIHLESSIDDLFKLNTLIKVAKESCLEKELSSAYYGLNDRNRLKLSTERNNYINLLSIAEEKLFLIINTLEDYNSTPTIAADK